MATVLQLHQQHTHVSGYVDGLYDELSKLSIKRPRDDVSQLTVNQVNRAIRDTKSLMAGEDDPYIGDILEFESAGDEPENRDVVLVLRQLKGALDRMHVRHRRSWLGY